jgi:hypothetical protein
MGLTLTRRYHLDTPYRRVTDVAFDSAYLAGGESLTPRQLGLAVVESVQILPHASGYQFFYDLTNQKLQAKRPSPAVVTEATGTFTAGVAYTLKRLPAYILAVRGTAGSTGAKRVIPVGETLSAGQCTVNFTTGVVTWGDATITAATIVYVPLGVPGFTSDLLVVDEASPIASNVITTANQAACIQYVWNNEDNEILNLVPVGESPSGAACAVDIDDGSGATKITVTSSRIADGTATKVTYLKRTNNPLRFVDQADRTVTSDVCGPGTDQTFDVSGIVLPGYGQVVVGETGAAANLMAVLVDADGTAAANVGVYNPWRNTFTLANADSYATLEIPLLYLTHELAGGVMLEAVNGADLSGVTGVRLIAEGY